MARNDEREVGPSGKVWKELAQAILDSPEDELPAAAEFLDGAIRDDYIEGIGEIPVWIRVKLIRLRVMIGLRSHGYTPTEKQGVLW